MPTASTILVTSNRPAGLGAVPGPAGRFRLGFPIGWIVEGPETYVERINISGNTRTEERVLRRELPIAEGDLFMSQKLAQLKQRLTNLKYFDRVTVTTAPNTERDALARAKVARCCSPCTR